MENFNYATKSKEINFLVESGFDILEVIDQNGNSHFFSVKEFEPPINGSVHSAPYIEFKGIDISLFLTHNVYNQGNTELFRQKFESHIKSTNIRFKFSDKHYWRYYSM